MPGLKRKFLFQLILAFTQLAFPLITYPYLARVLGPTGIGKVGYMEFVAGLVITLCAVGIPYYGVREIAKHRNNKPAREKIISDLLAIHILYSIIGIAVFSFFILVNSNYHNEKQLLVLGSFYILLQVFTVEWYLQGTEAFEFIAWRTIVIRVLGIGAILFFIQRQSDYVLYYGIIVVTQLLIAIISISKAVKENKLSFASVNFRKHAKPLFYLFLTSSFISVYVFFDTIILGYLTNEEHVGIYTFSLRIIKLPLLLLLSLNTILYPRLSWLHAEGDHDTARRFMNFTMKFIIVVTVPVCLCFYLLAPEVISFLGGSNFIPAVKVLRILSPLPLLIGFSNFFFLQVMAPRQKEKWVMITVLIACLVSLSVNFWLIPSLKEQGAAIAALVTEGVVFFLLTAFSFDVIGNDLPGKTIAATLIASIPAIPVVLLTRNYFSSALTVLIFSLFVFGCIYILLQFFVFKNEIFREMVMFKKRANTMLV